MCRSGVIAGTFLLVSARGVTRGPRRAEDAMGEANIPADRDEASVWVDAPPETVWEHVTAIERYGEWSPENRGGRWVGEPGLGATFKGSNKRGPVRWTTRCEVVEYDRPGGFAFDVSESKMRWGYRMEPEEGGTRVTEWRAHVGTPPPLIRLIVASGLFGRRREGEMVEGMRSTLEQIKATVER
jgi:uncharacterized protein YndB with AHSA1/START domain